MWLHIIGQYSITHEVSSVANELLLCRLTMKLGELQLVTMQSIKKDAVIKTLFSNNVWLNDTFDASGEIISVICL